MYSLTLTGPERRAFDRVGNRYRTGDAVAHILYNYFPFNRRWSDGGWSDGGWSDGGTITFLVPEHAARGIVHLAAEEGNLWPGFGTGLAVKMSDFVAAIV